MPKYISRVGKHWLVSIECAESKHRPMFPDSKYGGKEESFAKAIEYRDKMIEEEGLIFVEDRKVFNNIKSNNTSGINGVSRNCGHYHAQISVKPRQKKFKKFSINKWGEEVAFKKAVAWRKGMELVVYGHSRIKD